MANAFFQPGPQRAARVNDLFSGIARRYDLVNDLQSAGLHRLWKRRLVQMARVGPRCRALDLCCGTGDVALGLARAGASVVGLDFSGPMLALAARRAGTQAPALAGRLQWVHGDALHTPFADASFEVVTFSYGLRNLASVEAGLTEAWRVARPGARLLVLDFGKPRHCWWRRLYFAYLRAGVPLLGRLFCGDRQAYAYILESLEHYPAQDGVAALMRQFKGAQVQVVSFLGGVMTINYCEKLG